MKWISFEKCVSQWLNWNRYFGQKHALLTEIKLFMWHWWRLEEQIAGVGLETRFTLASVFLMQSGFGKKFSGGGVCSLNIYPPLTLTEWEWEAQIAVGKGSPDTVNPKNPLRTLLNNSTPLLQATISAPDQFRNNLQYSRMLELLKSNSNIWLHSCL